MASCLSESSSTSDTELNPPHHNIHLMVGKKEKEEIDQDKGGGELAQLVPVANHQRKHDYSQELELNKTVKPVLELDLISSLAGGSLPRRPQMAETWSDSRVYSCHYCDKKFNSSQALGGHQNAHKTVRALASRRNRSATIPAIHDHHQHSMQQCSRIPPTLPIYGPFARSSLGIMTHSMVHKPPPPPLPHSAWPRPILDRKPAILDTKWRTGGSCHLNDEKEELKSLDLSLKL